MGRVRRGKAVTDIDRAAMAAARRDGQKTVAEEVDRPPWSTRLVECWSTRVVAAVVAVKAVLPVVPAGPPVLIRGTARMAMVTVCPRGALEVTAVIESGPIAGDRAVPAR